MRQINPMMKAWSNAEKTYIQREQSKIYRDKRWEAGRQFLAGKHQYERTFSDKSTGEMRVMIGKDAKSLNDGLFNDFLEAMDANVEGRSLERWKVVNRFIDEE